MTLINFKLQDIDQVAPFGKKDNLSLHWFALTDGELWIDLGSSTIYEYTDEALKHFGGDQKKYNDYQISRFIAC